MIECSALGDRTPPYDKLTHSECWSLKHKQHDSNARNVYISGEENIGLPLMCVCINDLMVHETSSSDCFIFPRRKSKNKGVFSVGGRVRLQYALCVSLDLEAVVA